MSKLSNNDWGNKPLIVIISLVGSIIGIVIFFSGKPSIKEFFPNLTPTNTHSLSLPECPADPAPTRYVTKTTPPIRTPVPTYTPPPPGTIGQLETGDFPLEFAIDECYKESVEELFGIPKDFLKPTLDEMQSLPLLQASETCTQTRPSSVIHQISIPINSTWLWRFQSCSSNDVFASNPIFLRSGEYGACDITENFLYSEYNDGANLCKTWTTKLALTKDIVWSVQYSLISDSHEAGVDLWFSPGIYEQKFLVTIK
ncbi:MAG: hypothetical protein IH589_06680 [Anaerolineales bacterium]|nr:hypothetical protein [Anaerolineales bacterium]